MEDLELDDDGDVVEKERQWLGRGSTTGSLDTLRGRVRSERISSRDLGWKGRAQGKIYRPPPSPMLT